MALSDSWKIKGGDITDWVTCASLNIPDLRFSFRNRSVDTLSFTIPVAKAAQPLFSKDAAISVQLMGTLVFFGTIQETPEISVTGSRESISYTVVGPWWHLEHTVYQQAYAAWSGGAVGTSWKSHLTLGQNAAGVRIITSDQISDALAYAVSAEAPFQIGEIFDGVLAPTRDGSDMSCAEVVKQMIRWTPDISAWFDYSTTPPTLHMKRRADLTAKSISITQEISDTLHIKSREDLQVPVVALKFEQTSTYDGASYTSIAVDKFPTDGNEKAVNALINTMQLSGLNTTLQKQPVVTRALPLETSADSTKINWVRNRERWLAKLLSSDQLKLVTSSYYREIPPGQYYLDGVTPIEVTGGSALSPTDVPNELVSGSITDWMQDAYPNLQACKVVVGAALQFNGDSAAVWALTGLTDAQKELICQAFNLYSDPSDPNYNIRWWYYEVTATNASSMVYKVVSSVTGGEEAPTGLAQQLYVALNTLHHEGDFITKGAEISTAVGLGNVLNLTGDPDHPEWESMNAQVQTISWEAASGRATVEFGPPEHLSAQDMLEFLRSLRALKPVSGDLESRTTGAASTSIVTGGAGWTPSTTPQHPPSGGGSTVTLLWHPYQINVLSNLTDGTPQVEVDSNSDLWKPDFVTKQAITGLGTAITPVIGQVIVVYIGVTSKDEITPDEANVDQIARPASPFQMETDENGIPYQTGYYQVLAEVVATTDTRDGKTAGSGDKAVKIIEEGITSALICAQLPNVNGVICLVPRPIVL